jgi:hypothetical protein
MTICRHLGVNFEEFVELIEEYVQIQKTERFGFPFGISGLPGFVRPVYIKS